MIIFKGLEPTFVEFGHFSQKKCDTAIIRERALFKEYINVAKDNPTGHSERKKKKRQTEEEVGRQYQRVDKNGLCQLN